ncbi:MAG: hypothetical protein R3Y32_06870 [Bacillota bacterium]
MKKNTVKKLNTVFVSFLLILTVFFCSFGSCFTTAFASDLFPCDCPDCSDGTTTTQITTDCTASGCVDGEITTEVSSTCLTCSGNAVVYTSTSATCTTCSGVGSFVCSSCSGKGYITFGEDIDDYTSYHCIACTACGGFGGSPVGYGSSTLAKSQFDSRVLSGTAAYGSGSISCSVCSGTGTKTTVTSSDCPDCTDGNIYTTATSDCPACIDGEITTESTITCPTCDGTQIIYIGLDNLSTIPTVLMTEDTEFTVVFTYGELGDVGSLEFVWYINNIAYKVTDTASLTLTELPVGIYGMYCEITSSVGFSTTTNQFEIQVNPAQQTTYIQIAQQPSSYTIKQGESVAIELDEENASAVVWYVNDIETASDVMEIDLSVYDIGVYEIYCEYTIEEESFTSDVATVSIVNDDGFTEDIESAWDNVVSGFWIAIGAGLAAALLAYLAVKASKK